MKVLFTLSIGFPNAKQSEVVDLDDDLTDDEIGDAYLEWRNDYLDGGWTKQ